MNVICFNACPVLPSLFPLIMNNMWILFLFSWVVVSIYILINKVMVYQDRFIYVSLVSLFSLVSILGTLDNFL